MSSNRTTGSGGICATGRTIAWWVTLAACGLLLSGCQKSAPETQTGANGATPAKSKPAIQAVLPEGQPRPNVVFILVDALRADRLGVYGNRARLTPTMDSLAATGVVFDHCESAAPWTLPSVATIFTSYYPGVHKAKSYQTVQKMEDGLSARQSVLSDDFQTLAEALHEAGYETAGFCGNKFIRAPYGFAQGFDHFDTTFAENTVAGAKINAAAIKWIDSRPEPHKPMFLYLHYMDVHGPYDAAPKFLDPLVKRVEEMKDKHMLTPAELHRMNAYLRKPPAKTSDPQRYNRLKAYREYWEARYDAGVAEADFYLGQMFGALKKRGLLDNTLIVLLADHGEALCEHGLWEHGYSLYQTDLHVPLVLHWKGVLPAGMHVRRLCSLIDVMPTLLEQLRIQPGDPQIQGHSLVPYITGTLPDMPVERFAEAIKAGPYQFAVFADMTKLIVTEVPPRRMPDGTLARVGLRRQLFNLATDPTEKFNIADQNRGQVEMMTKLLQAIATQNKNAKPHVVPQKRRVEPETIRKLEQLGYAGSSEDDQDEPAQTPQTRPSSAPVKPPQP